MIRKNIPLLSHRSRLWSHSNVKSKVNRMGQFLSRTWLCGYSRCVMWSLRSTGYLNIINRRV